MKKNQIKKATAAVLTGVMCTGLAACGGSSSASSTAAASSASSISSESEASSASSSSKSEAASTGDFETGLTIAQNSFLAGDYAFTCMLNVANIVVEGSGNTLNELSDNADINQVQADVESMINSQVDGALWWGVLDNYYQVGPQLFNDAQVPFAFFDCAPSADSGIQDSIDEMEYYAGSCIANNETFGEQMAEQALADGCKKAIVFANEIGSSAAVRADKFKEVFEAGGGEVLEVSHVSTTSNAHVEATQNMLATYSDVDCIYGVSIDFILGAYTVTSQTGDRDIKLYATDASPEALEYLENGSINGLNGGHFVEDYVAACLLMNTIDGHKIVGDDGKPLNLTLDPVVVTPETVDLYEKFWIDGNPYEYDDISYLLYRENSEVTADDFYEFCENYSIESVLQLKYDQGLVTDEELEAAGIEL